MKVSGKDSAESGNANSDVAQAENLVEHQAVAHAMTEDALDAGREVATQTVWADTQGVGKSHHKKKSVIKCLSQPLPLPQCVDTLYDQNYIPSPPYPSISEDPTEWVEDWEAPIMKKPKSQKRKAPATSEPNSTGSNTVAKKKATKKPKKTSAKPHLEPPKGTIPILQLHARRPHAKKTPKAHATASKEAERKEPCCLTSS